MKLAAAILAGGRATRLSGIQKALITVAGLRIIDRQLRALSTITDEILIVAPDPTPFADLAARVIVDRRPGLGPLAGLEAAFLATDANALILVASDMPALSPIVLNYLATVDENADAIVPFVDGRPEPLHARYHRRILPRVQSRLDANQLALHALLDDLRVHRLEESALRTLDPTLLTLANINTPADLARITHLLG